MKRAAKVVKDHGGSFLPLILLPIQLAINGQTESATRMLRLLNKLSLQSTVIEYLLCSL